MGLLKSRFPGKNKKEDSITQSFIDKCETYDNKAITTGNTDKTKTRYLMILGCQIDAMLLHLPMAEKDAGQMHSLLDYWFKRRPRCKLERDSMEAAIIDYIEKNNAHQTLETIQETTEYWDELLEKVPEEVSNIIEKGFKSRKATARKATAQHADHYRGGARIELLEDDPSPYADDEPMNLSQMQHKALNDARARMIIMQQGRKTERIVPLDAESGALEPIASVVPFQSKPTAGMEIGFSKAEMSRFIRSVVKEDTDEIRRDVQVLREDYMKTETCVRSLAEDAKETKQLMQETRKTSDQLLAAVTRLSDQLDKKDVETGGASTIGKKRAAVPVPVPGPDDDDSTDYEGGEADWGVKGEKKFKPAHPVKTGGFKPSATTVVRAVSGTSRPSTTTPVGAVPRAVPVTSRPSTTTPVTTVEHPATGTKTKKAEDYLVKDFFPDNHPIHYKETNVKKQNVIKDLIEKMPLFNHVLVVQNDLTPLGPVSQFVEKINTSAKAERQAGGHKAAGTRKSHAEGSAAATSRRPLTLYRASPPRGSQDDFSDSDQ